MSKLCERCCNDPIEFLCYPKPYFVEDVAFGLCRKCYQDRKAKVSVIGRDTGSRCLICEAVPSKQLICDCPVDNKLADFEVNLRALNRDWRAGLLTFGEYQAAMKELIGSVAQ